MPTLEKSDPVRKIIRVVVVDDHPWVRAGIISTMTLHPEFLVCGEAEEAESALAVIADSTPDIALVDISLKGDVDGIVLTAMIKKQFPSVVVLILSMHVEVDYAIGARAAGACGYLLKSEASGFLLEAITRCMDGRWFFSEALRRRMRF